MALWQLHQADERGARETLTVMRADSSGAVRAVCVRIIEAGLMPLSDRLPILVALDSVVSSQSFVADREVEASDLSMVLAIAFEEHGEYERALGALMRQLIGLGYRYPFLSARYRREGRLALAVGDTTRAIDAFERYMRFRDAPEPALQAETDEIRAQLAVLVAR